MSENNIFVQVQNDNSVTFTNDNNEVVQGNHLVDKLIVTDKTARTNGDIALFTFVLPDETQSASFGATYEGDNEDDKAVYSLLLSQALTQYATRFTGSSMGFSFSVKQNVGGTITLRNTVEGTLHVSGSVDVNAQNTLTETQYEQIEGQVQDLQGQAVTLDETVDDLSVRMTDEETASAALTSRIEVSEYDIETLELGLATETLARTNADTALGARIDQKASLTYVDTINENANTAVSTANTANATANEAQTAVSNKSRVTLNGTFGESVSLWAATSGGTTGQFLKSNGSSSSPTWADLPSFMTYKGSVNTYADLPSGIKQGTYVKTLTIKAGTKEALKARGSINKFTFRDSNNDGDTASYLSYDNTQDAFSFFVRDGYGTSINFTTDNTFTLNQLYKGTTSAPISDYATFNNVVMPAEYTDSSDVFHPLPNTGDVYNVVAAYGDYPAGTNYAWNGTTWDALGGSFSIDVDQTYNATSANAQSGVAVAQAVSGKATAANFTATIGTTWTGSEAPFTQTIAVTGILSTDTPIIDIVPSSVYATAEAEEADWAKIYRITTANDSITVYAKEQTTMALIIQIKVVR